MEEKKRKTRTSTAVKARYNKKTYTAITAYVPKDLAAAFKEKCKATGTPQAQVVRDAVEKFLTE